jgi:hypothetical protein
MMFAGSNRRSRRSGQFESDRPSGLLLADYRAIRRARSDILDLARDDVTASRACALRRIPE